MPRIQGLEVDRSSRKGCPLCGGLQVVISRSARQRLKPKKPIFIQAELQLWDFESDPQPDGSVGERGPRIITDFRPLCIVCTQRFPACVFCMHWNGKRGWSHRHPASRGECRKGTPPWPQALSLQSCGEFEAILTHVFTLKQLEELHERGPAAITAEWFEEQSP